MTRKLLRNLVIARSAATKQSGTKLAALRGWLGRSLLRFDSPLCWQYLQIMSRRL
jgi:hypothetical protein